MANEINAVAGQLWGIPIGEVYTAGPGIKIDNVHKVVSVDETVLWEDENGVNLNTGITLSESRLNFESIKLTYCITATGAPAVLEIPMIGANRGTNFTQTLPGAIDDHLGSVAGYFVVWQLFFASCTNTYLKSDYCQFMGKMNFKDGSTPGSWTQGNNSSVPIVFKVVGIHRIAGGN